MKNYKVLLESIDATDAKALKDMQKKLNQWMTSGKLKKYEIHIAGTIALFNVCLKK